MMTKKVTEKLYETGIWVKIRHSGWPRAKIVEYRGPLGPNGAHIYRLQVRGKPSPAFVEVREDQIIPLPKDE